MSSPNVVTIKLEIQVPTGCPYPVVSGPIVAGDAPANRPGSRGTRTLTQSRPSTGDRIPVRPSGSGPFGTICGWARLANAPADSRPVRAQVVQSSLGLGTEPDPGATATGAPDYTRTYWTWTTGNEIPGAQHNAYGLPNMVVFWEPYGTDPHSWVSSLFDFVGYTGTSDPCGGTAPMPAPAPAKTYPAVWCVLIAGFDGPLALFNATWALRADPRSTTPTWNNAADGSSSPGVWLKLCPKNGWEIRLRYGGNEKSWTIPYAANPFGPVAFQVGGAGRTTILASVI
jgi:hypothetical protein